jgi:hypothetical protein
LWDSLEFEKCALSFLSPEKKKTASLSLLARKKYINTQTVVHEIK